MTREERKQHNYNLIHKIINGVEYKQCTNKSHQEWLPMTEEYFYKSKYSKTDGFNSWCKECCKKAGNNRYDKDPEKYKQRSYDYRTPRQGAYRESVRQWKKDNREYRRIYEKDYYAKNPEKCRDYSKQHRLHDITEKEWRGCLTAFGNTCAYCGLPIEKHIIKKNNKYIIMVFHREHVDDDGYNDLRNAVPACRSCNSQKWQLNFEQWYRRQTFFTEERYNKIIWWTTEGYKDYIDDKPPYRIVKEKNEDNNKFHFNLWSVDEKRNLLEIIMSKPKRKDLDKDIEQYLLTLK